MMRTCARATRVAIAVAALGGAVTACGGGGASDGDRREGASPTASRTGSRIAGGSAAAASAADETTAAKRICPATGAWQMCSVVERLERAGFPVRREPGTVRERSISTPGVVLMLGRTELRVFLYADRAARERDQARIDMTKYITPNEALSMPVRPTLIASENLLAILHSRRDRQRERVSDALTAGPPQSPGTTGTKG